MKHKIVLFISVRELQLDATIRGISEIYVENPMRGRTSALH